MVRLFPEDTALSASSLGPFTITLIGASNISNAHSPLQFSTMSAFSIFGYSIKSYVDTFYAPNSATVQLKDGSSSSLADLISKNIPEAAKGYSYWNKLGLGNGDTQTLYAAAGDFEKVDKIYYGRRLMVWENGDTNSIDYVIDPPLSKESWEEALEYAPEPGLPKLPVRTRYLTPEEIMKIDNPDQTVPFFINLHGLSGGSHESYVRSQINHVITSYPNEFEAAVLNSRGCARTPITTPMLFNGVLTDDIRRLVKFVRKTQPNRRIYLAGYSLGASILANYLGQEGEHCEVAGAICLANPWDLMTSAFHIQESFLGKHLYSPTMTRNLNRLMSHHKEKLSVHGWFEEAWKLPKAKTLPEFDDRFTSRMFGFDNAFDYYRNGSSVNRLMEVRVPLLILSSEDDPIVGRNGIPYREAIRNPYIYLVTTTVGGHLGWFQYDGTRWNNRTVADYLHLLDTKVDYSKENAIHAQVLRPTRLWTGDRLDLSKFTVSK